MTKIVFLLPVLTPVHSTTKYVVYGTRRSYYTRTMIESEDTCIRIILQNILYSKLLVD
jgi:hypothetical protein